MTVQDLDAPVSSSLFGWGFKDGFLYILISIWLCTIQKKEDFCEIRWMDFIEVKVN